MAIGVHACRHAGILRIHGPHLEHRLEAVRLGAKKISLPAGVPRAHQQRVYVSTCSSATRHLRGSRMSMSTGRQNIHMSVLAVVAGQDTLCARFKLLYMDRVQPETNFFTVRVVKAGINSGAASCQGC